MPADVQMTGTGLLRWTPGRERYRVPGGGAIALALSPGDRLAVVDVEGRQRCELGVFGPDGNADPSRLGVRADGPMEGFASALRRGDESAQAADAALRRRGVDLARARAVQVFGGETEAGAEACFDVADDAVCLIAAPGGPMSVDAQDPPTELDVVVRRSRVEAPERHPLPSPLGDMRLDLEVERASAIAYEVKAGEFIQVIDAAGRQCSDFLAFDARQLQRGIERGLDATTTRTLMGRAYPGPGLFSKFCDQDMQPLVEVVRDTVGRHDTFALACTARYYEDMGYPGHVNCTDNFNSALDPYTIQPRRGWPAVNFFYNTRIDLNNVLFLDEPWSRPGDYVLLKALTDLVCLSSACPDDIDPANGWEPTEIQVRVYPERYRFSRGIAHRMTADAEPRLTRETAFHRRTSALTRHFEEYRGYWLPSSFTRTGAVEEYYACREAAAVMDLSALRKFEVLGPDAEALLQHTLTRDVRRLSAGQVTYSAMCYETGGMLDDGTLFRLGPENFRWICGEDYGGVWLREQASRRGMRVWVRNATDQLHNLAVQGPRSRDILDEIIWTPPSRPSLAELGWFRFTVGRIDDGSGAAVVVSRTGYTGELGYEVWCHPDDAPAVWDAIWESGQPHGLTPLGLEALDMLRIEAGLVFAGCEFDDQTDPFEAGIGFTVPLKRKKDDFIGKEALIRRRSDPQRVLVGLELSGNEPAATGDDVYDRRGRVGVITSGTRSPILGRNIALCRLATGYAAVGVAVEVGRLDGHQKRIPARVVRFPFYDPEKTRPRA